MNKRHRRISPGTVIMLMITCVVLVGCAMVLPGLMGSTSVQIDVREVLSVLQLGDIPTLSLNDIPITQSTSGTSGTSGTSSLSSSTPAANPQETIAPIEASATAAPTATPTVKAGGSFTLTIGGSVCMDDAVRKAGYYSDAQKYDFTEMLSLLTDEMTGDMTMLSLENLILPDSKGSSLNAPDAVSDMLRECGVQMVALGFDQVYDKGTDGVQSTLSSLQSRNLTVIGAYASQEEASQLCIKTLGGVPVAFLHYTEALSTTGTKAMKSSGDSYAVKLADSDTIAADIAQARAQGAAVVIVSVNWGKSGASKPTNAQRTLAQEIADAGADVIVGTGTRVVQPIAWLTRKSDDGTIAQTLCAWSLGSLLNESRKDGNVAAILLHLQISWDGERISFGQVSYTPTYIWRQKKDGQYQYRVVASDCDAPGGMSDDQHGYMAKALKNIQSALADSPVVIREK